MAKNILTAIPALKKVSVPSFMRNMADGVAVLAYWKQLTVKDYGDSSVTLNPLDKTGIELTSVEKANEVLLKIRKVWLIHEKVHFKKEDMKLMLKLIKDMREAINRS